jgi:NAD(P)-dependent dehydrogenase (short-subunit alcohol dehydrogenase family)
MNITDLTGKVALVTGAASGIGRETALAFASRGADLAICDLNEEALEAFAREVEGMGRKVIRRRVDVADRADMEQFAAFVHSQVPAVDILMNNAGVGLGGGFLHTSLDDWDWVLGINLKGVIHGCHFFLPPMVERRSGHVINVASAAGLVATETLAAYSTTKFAVVGLSEALRDELSPYGIGVTTICPGIINTPITRNSRMVGPLATEQTRSELVAAYEKRNYGPERVAANILRAVEKNRAVAPISPEAWFMYYGKRCAPGLIARFARSMSQRERRRRNI